MNQQTRNSHKEERQLLFFAGTLNSLLRLKMPLQVELNGLASFLLKTSLIEKAKKIIIK